MKFKDLKIGQKFTRKDRDLIWNKSEPFTAYGFIKNQNAAACFSHPLRTVWHYDKIDDEEEIDEIL